MDFEQFGRELDRLGNALNERVRDGDDKKLRLANWYEALGEFDTDIVKEVFRRYRLNGTKDGFPPKPSDARKHCIILQEIRLRDIEKLEEILRPDCHT